MGCMLENLPGGAAEEKQRKENKTKEETQLFSDDRIASRPSIAFRTLITSRALISFKPLLAALMILMISMNTVFAVPTAATLSMAMDAPKVGTAVQLNITATNYLGNQAIYTCDTYPDEPNWAQIAIYVPAYCAGPDCSFPYADADNCDGDDCRDSPVTPEEYAAAGVYLNRGNGWELLTSNTVQMVNMTNGNDNSGIVWINFTKSGRYAILAQSCHPNPEDQDYVASASYTDFPIPLMTTVLGVVTDDNGNLLNDFTLEVLQSWGVVRSEYARDWTGRQCNATDPCTCTAEHPCIAEANLTGTGGTFYVENVYDGLIGKVKASGYTYEPASEQTVDIREFPPPQMNMQLNLIENQLDLYGYVCPDEYCEDGVSGMTVTAYADDGKSSPVSTTSYYNDWEGYEGYYETWLGPTNWTLKLNYNYYACADGCECYDGWCNYECYCGVLSDTLTTSYHLHDYSVMNVSEDEYVDGGELYRDLYLPQKSIDVYVMDVTNTTGISDVFVSVHGELVSAGCKTGWDGRCTLSWLIPGDYTVTSIFQGTEVAHPSVTVPSEGSASIYLQSGGAISGAVLNPSGNPIAGANVLVENTEITAITNENGEYSVAIPPGTYTISAWKDPTYTSNSVSGVVVVEGSITQAPLIYLPYGAGMGCGGDALINGYVMDAANVAIANAVVNVFPQSGGSSQGGSGMGGESAGGGIGDCYGMGYTDENGYYSIVGLKAGTYTLHAEAAGTDLSSMDISDIVISEENEMLGYNVTLITGAKITGRVINATGGGIFGAFVNAFGYNGGYGSAMSRNACSPVSSCSVYNDNWDYCVGSGCTIASQSCAGMPEISCSDITDASCSNINGCTWDVTACTGVVECNSYGETDCQTLGCDWINAPHCQGSPSSCGGKPDAQSCATELGCIWTNPSCTGTVDCSVLDPMSCLGGCIWDNELQICTGAPDCGSVDPGNCDSTPGCTWNWNGCAGDPAPCYGTYSNEEDCNNGGCFWDTAPCHGAPDCGPISQEICNGISGCSGTGICQGDTIDCSAQGGETGCGDTVPGCAWTPACVGEPASCESLSGENCNSVIGCGLATEPVCSGVSYSCDSYSDGSSCSSVGCGWIEAGCSGEPYACEGYSESDPCYSVGCEWDGELCYGTAYSCDSYSDGSSCSYAGCGWIEAGCFGEPYACGGYYDGISCNDVGCLWEEALCSGTPESCGNQGGGCVTSGCYWNSDPCVGTPNAEQCIYQSDQSSCESSLCVWDISNIGIFTLKGLQAGTYDLQVQPPWGTDYSSKVFPGIATVTEGGETNIGDLTIGTAGIITGCVTDSQGNAIQGVTVGAYQPNGGGYGWAQTQPTGCSGGVWTCEGYAGYEANVLCTSLGCDWSDTNELGAYCFDSSATDKATCESTGGIWKGCTGMPHSCEYWNNDVNSCPASYGCTWDGSQSCFRMTGLTTGTYVVEVNPPQGSDLAKATIQSVSVIEGEETQLNVSFGVSSSIYGYVDDGQVDSPIPGAYINVVLEGASPFSPPEDWGWGMAQEVGCVMVPPTTCADYHNPGDCSVVQCTWVGDTDTGQCTGTIPPCTSFSSSWESCSMPGGCSWDDNIGCYGQCTSYTDDAECADWGCAWDSRAFYRITGLKGSDTKRYVVMVQPPYDSGFSQKVNPNVMLPVGGSVEVNFTLSTGGRIYGRVVNVNGGPVQAGVGAFMPSKEEGMQMSSGGGGWSSTDENGDYNITGLPSGTYDVEVYPWTSGVTSGHDKIAVEDGGSAELNFTLGSGGGIRGRILKDGSAVSGASIDLWSSEQHAFGWGMAGPDGTFELSGLVPASDYTMTIRKYSALGMESPTYVSGISVVAGETTELGDITFILATGGIYGAATYANGSSIANAYVNAWSKDSMAFGWAQTNGSGDFNITGLPSGNYDVMLDLWQLGLPNKFSSVEVDTTQVQHDFVLADSVSIYGYVGRGTMAADSIDTNPGTLVNGPAWTAGKVGNALSFDGIDDYVDLSNPSILNNISGASAITVMGWVYQDSWEADRTIFDAEGSGPAVNLCSNYFTVWTATGDSAEISYEILGEGWHHIVGTYDGSYLTLYVDGGLAGQTSLSGNLGTPTVAVLGARSRYGWWGNRMDGLLDEVAVFNMALNASEIQQHYQNGLNGNSLCQTASECPAGIVSYWKLDEGPIQSARVSVWNSHTYIGMGDSTDASGFYNMTIDPGTYSMRISAPGFFEYFNDSVEIASSMEMDVTLTDVNSETTYTLNGTVTINGSAQNKATVIAYGGSDNIGSGITDANGFYSISNLRSGLYKLTVVIGSTAYDVADVDVTVGTYDINVTTGNDTPPIG